MTHIHIDADDSPEEIERKIHEGFAPVRAMRAAAERQLHFSIPEDGPKLIPTETGYTYRCNTCGWRTGVYPKKVQARGAFAHHRCP